MPERRPGEQQVVVYQSLQTKILFHRPLFMFMEIVQLDGKAVKRFLPVEEMRAAEFLSFPRREE